MKRKLSESQSLFLDLTRGLSALAVLFGHGLSVINSRPAIGTIYPVQSYGVVIFFIISGFLIGYNCYLRGDQYSFKNYMIDRFSRIYTVFIPAALFVFLVDIVISSRVLVLASDRMSIVTALANLAMFFQTPVNILVPGLPVIPAWGTASQWWTVAVEWWLYVLFGAMFFLRGSTLGEKAAMTALFVPAMLVVMVFFIHESLAFVWFISAGVGYLFSSAKFDGRPGTSFGFIVFLGIAYVFRFSYLNKAGVVNFYDFQFMMISTFLYFSILLSLPSMTLSENIKKYLLPISQWLANISYSLYLTHLTIIAVYVGLTGGMSVFGFIVVSVISIGVADVFYRLFDKHHRLVRDRLKSMMSSGNSATLGFQRIQGSVLAAGLVLLAVSAVALTATAYSGSRRSADDAAARLRSFVSIREVGAADRAFFGAGDIYDPARGVSLWKRSVGKGVIEAKYMLAIYAHEHLAETDNRRDILRLASAAGYPEAAPILLQLKDESLNGRNTTDILASVYQQAVRLNTSPDEVQRERGARLMLELAKMGQVDSMVMFGDAVRSGRMYVKQPISVAVMFWELASEKGNSLADYLLGETFFLGSGDVSANRERAKHYYGLARSRGYPILDARLKEVGLLP